MKYRYIVLSPGEDGEYARLVTKEELDEDYLKEMAYELKFLDESALDDARFGPEPQSWPPEMEGSGHRPIMIVEIAAIRVPRPVTTEYEL